VAAGTKILEPDVPMKGIVDPAMVGTWRYHDDARDYGQNYSVFYIFRDDGTYTLYQDYTGATQPPPATKSFWRIDGEYLEVLYVGTKVPFRVKLTKAMDPNRNQPILIIQWNTGRDDYRTYYPVRME
jgi:hypothetical protein